jgi:HlyD family secretion protein
VIANDLAKMEIDALVSEADIGSVTVGQDVNFSVDAYPYRTFHGKVSQIRYGAITNQSVVTYDAVIGVNNADLKLLPGMTANVSIVIAQRENALKIPNAALRFHPPDVGTESKTNHNEKMLAQNSGTNSGMAGGGGGSGKGPGGMGPGGMGMGPGGFGARPNRGMGGGPGGPGGNRPPRPERQLVRTVYLMPPNVDGKNANEFKPKPVQIKVGISDGISTEVMDGLNEGDQIAVGIISGYTGSPAGAPANPFGGGGFRRF